MIWCPVKRAVNSRLAGSWAGSWRVLIRSRSRARSAAVNFQLNGLAVWLYRSVNASRVAASWAVVAKSQGETTSFCTMEKKIWFSQDAWTGVWIMMAFGVDIAQPPGGFLSAVV